MSEGGRGSCLGALLSLCVFGVLCGGCGYGCLMPMILQQKRAAEEYAERKKQEDAIVQQYAPDLPEAIRSCEERISSWNTDLESLAQTIRSVGKDPRRDPDVKEGMEILQELREVQQRLEAARGDLIIALKKTEVQTSKGDEETRLRKAQATVQRAVEESKKAIRIASAKQRKISGAMGREDLAGTTKSSSPDDDDDSSKSGSTTDSPGKSATPPKSDDVASGPPTSAKSPPAESTSSPAPSVPSEKPALTKSVPPDSTAPKKTSAPKENPAEQVDGVGIRLKLIPAGEFEMGAERADIEAILTKSRNLSDKAKERLSSELPKHKVKITRPFYLGATEVTVGQFAKFVAAASYQTTAEANGATRTWQKPGFTQSDNFPVTAVSWVDATAFCQWLGQQENATYRLPTEAEWEYACRAGSTTAWFWNKTPEKIENFAWTGVESPKKTRAVATKEPNKFGLFDMQGNVSEWCQDWYQSGYYVESPINDPTGPSAGTERVIRGGAVLLTDPSFFRSSLRGGIREDSELVGVGFRVVREVVTDDTPR